MVRHPAMRDWRAVLGKNVRRLRSQKGLTQEELAFEAEIDLTYMGGIERGKRNPSLLVMARIADALSVPLTKLLNDWAGFRAGTGPHMLFSDAYGVQRTAEDDWFDPLLNLDTKLFIDPFLWYDNEAADFAGSHAEAIRFFNHVLQLIARSNGNTTSALWQQAETLLRLPEVEELCLGYTSLGTRGSGSGRKIARQLAGGLLKAIRAGVVELTHFEEVQIFEEDIGADRIFYPLGRPLVRLNEHHLLGLPRLSWL
jgi:transcriptional regulator with XRE-family HTH domain